MTYLKIFILILSLSSCVQTENKMTTPADAKNKFAEFIGKEKFNEVPYPNFYPGIADNKMQPICTEKINQVATDFLEIATSENPTDKKYHEIIGLGLSRFADVYLELDTEDRERVCTYFEELMDIVGLESSNGQLNKFMYGFDPNN